MSCDTLSSAVLRTNFTLSYSLNSTTHFFGCVPVGDYSNEEFPQKRDGVDDHSSEIKADQGLVHH